MSTPNLPNYKNPPLKEVLKAKAERVRRMKCHGDWQLCENVHECKHPNTRPATKSDQRPYCVSCLRITRSTLGGRTAN